MLRALAALFAAVTILYGAAWMYYSLPFSPHDLAQSSLVGGYAFYPVIFLGVGLSVLALRLSDPNAWLMAALFACLLTGLGFPRATSSLPWYLAGFVRAYEATALPAIPALFYAFFARFPARSPIDQKLPWLKWLNVAGWMLFALPNLRRGVPSAAPKFLVDWLGAPVAGGLRLGYLFAGIPLGIVALTWNAMEAPAEARRKARVLLWGTVVGTLPIVLESAPQVMAGWSPPRWANTGVRMMLSILPVSFAYAVVRHRVLDIPVLLKRSARYVLVRRGFAVLLVVIAATVTGVFAVSLSQLLDINVNVATAAGVAFGVALAVGSAPLVRRATTRIDRAFFRSAYDAAAILASLAEQIRNATSRAALATLVEVQVSQALHPVSMAVFLEDTDGKLHPFAERSSFPMPVLERDRPWLQELARRDRPWDVSTASTEQPAQVLRDSEAELLVPITGKRGRLSGVIALGMRASEEPYSGDDKRLLASAGNQAGIQLENIRLAEAMAERLDTERAAERELEIARQVQFRLFPQKLAVVGTLDYAGGCIQARQVGGDYYDFVDLGPGRVGLVVADISGKGIAGALLMANLQASLRSQYMVAADDLPGLLKSVNQLLYENTAENQYATLFFADYSDQNRRLRYANCGHFPPYLFHADGTIEPLMPTATVLGLFEDWVATTCDRELQPGDTLVIYTDGVTEAMNPLEEEFGTDRLQATVMAYRELPAAALVKKIQAAVQQFSRGSQSDDLTVVVAHVHERSAGTAGGAQVKS